MDKKKTILYEEKYKVNIPAKRTEFFFFCC